LVWFIKVLKKPKHSTGKGVNPCIDCRIFILRQAKEYADKNNIEIIVTGEVLGERPMSQYKKAMDIIEEETNLSGRILRPLSAKVLEETPAEKKGIINRKKLYAINGRQRKKQISLANHFKINYPTPAGGCLLCEKLLKKRFNLLLEKNLLNEKTLELAQIGRQFFIKDCWFVVARNKQESKIIEKKPKSKKINSEIGKPAIYLDKPLKENKEIAKELQEAFKTNPDKKQRNKFNKYKL
jgi:tRNA U34 2-thiouridine synthase MnmA/TrmU